MAEYRQPHAHVGMPALWYEGGNKGNVYAAIVLKVHAETVCLRVFGADSDFIKDSPRHVSDPRSKDTDKYDEGLWDHTELSKAFLAQKAAEEKKTADEADFSGSVGPKK